MQLQIRSSIWRFLLCFLFFVSSLQCLHAAPALRSYSQPRVKFGSLFKKGSSNTVSGSDHSGGGASSSGSLSAPAPASPPPRPDLFYPGEFVGVRVKGYTPGSVRRSPSLIAGSPDAWLTFYFFLLHALCFCVIRFGSAQTQHGIRYVTESRHYPPRHRHLRTYHRPYLHRRHDLQEAAWGPTSEACFDLPIRDGDGG